MVAMEILLALVRNVLFVNTVYIHAMMVVIITVIILVMLTVIAVLVVHAVQAVTAALVVQEDVLVVIIIAFHAMMVTFDIFCLILYILLHCQIYISLIYNL